MLLIIIVAVLLILIYLKTLKCYKYWERKGLEQKFPMPLFGDSSEVTIKRAPFPKMVMNIYNRFPNTRYTGFYHFISPALMIKDPELIKQMFVKDFEHFLDHRPFLPEDSDPLWNKNLFSLRGHKWKDMRSTLSPSFTGSKMKQMFTLMNECSENFVKFLTQDSKDLTEVQLKDLFTRYTNDVIATTSFGIKCDSLKDRENEFYTRGRQTTDLSGFWRNMKLVITFIVPSLSKLVGSSLFDKEASMFFRKIVQETLDYREKNKIERPDMINLLMQARKDTNNDNDENILEENNFAAVEEHLEVKSGKRKIDLTLDDITSQCLIFFFAGFETVSSGMCSMAYELATNPDIQQKLIEELDLYRAQNKTLTYDGLSKLTYLDMVFSETLRKWPVSIVTDRACVKPYTIHPQDPNEKPLHLTETDTLWLPIWALHHDPKYWENPEKFDPERFSPENKDKIVPYTYLPFGVGPRNCIGSRFAIIEVKAIFYALLEHFEIVPIEKSVIPFVISNKSFSLQSTDGFWFGLKKRNSTNL